MIEPGQKCDKCDARAVAIVVDIVDESRPDLGDVWRSFGSTGIRRKGCEAHPVASIEYPSPHALPPDAPWWTQREPAARERALGR